MDTIIIILSVSIAVVACIICYVFYSWWTDRSSENLQDALTTSVSDPKLLRGALGTLKGDNPDYFESRIQA